MVKDKEDVMPYKNRKGDEFVQALQRFHAGLPAEQQAMLDSIIGAAMQDETSGYGTKYNRTEDAPTVDQDDTAGYAVKSKRTEDVPGSEQDDDTSGYAQKWGRAEDAPSMAGTDSNDRWAKLAEWLNQADDDTSGHGGFRYP